MLPGPRSSGPTTTFFDGVRGRRRRAGARELRRVLRRTCRDPPAERIFSQGLRGGQPRCSTRSATSSSTTSRVSLEVSTDGCSDHGPVVDRRSGVPGADAHASPRALNMGLRAAMEADPKVIVMGEDVGKLGGVFRITDGLQKDFGEQRVLDTPLAESGIIGTAVGLAIRGFRPVCEIQFDGFIFPGFDQIVSQVAKLHYRTQGKMQAADRDPRAVRRRHRRGRAPLASRPSRYFAHTAGLKVVVVLEPGRRLLDDPAGHRQRRPGAVLRAEAALLREGARSTSTATPGPLFASRVAASRHDATLVALRPDGQDLPRRRHRGRRGRPRRSR